jgi:hypothetical protein
MDSNVIIQIVIASTNLIFVILTLISVILVYYTIKENKKINQRIIFNEIVKQEREVRIKLSEYREEIHKRIENNKQEKDWINITLDYDTLLFNYYEYLAACIFQEIVNESEIRRYFIDLVKAVKKRFEVSILFKGEYAQKDQYKGLQWLFKKWNL